MATILHKGAEVISIGLGRNGIPDFVDYRVVDDKNRKTNRWVRVRCDNWVHQSGVDIALLENRESPIQRPRTVNARSFDGKSRTLASIPELRKKGVRLMPLTNFPITNPTPIRADRVRIRP